MLKHEQTCMISKKEVEEKTTPVKIKDFYHNGYERIGRILIYLPDVPLKDMFILQSDGHCC